VGKNEHSPADMRRTKIAKPRTQTRAQWKPARARSSVTLASHSAFPGGCSTTNHFAPELSPMRSMSGHRLSPVRRPWIAAATLVRWQGGPPKTISHRAWSKVRTSSCSGIPGKWCASNRRRAGLISTNCTIRNPPAACRPRAWPPMLLKRSRTFTPASRAPARPAGPGARGKMSRAPGLNCCGAQRLKPPKNQGPKA
jgi:hypothetical protein